jgi:hypothetical protein
MFDEKDNEETRVKQAASRVTLLPSLKKLGTGRRPTALSVKE